MKKIILIVEDKLDQIDLAKEAVKTDSECTALIATNLEDAKRLFEQLGDKIFGVITDLHYSSMKGGSGDEDKPNGLAMVALCVEKNIRVAVCSDINHHYSRYLVEPLRVLATHQSYKYGRIPYSEDQKNWNHAFHNLLKLTI